MSVFNEGRDERTEQVVGVAARLALMFLNFGVLAVAAYRAAVLNQNTLDLLILVVVSNGILLGYQYAHRAMEGKALRAALWFGGLGAVVGLVMALYLSTR